MIKYQQIRVVILTLVVVKKSLLKDLAKTIKQVVGFKGKINFDDSKPDGNMRKFLDSKVINSLAGNLKQI